MANEQNRTLQALQIATQMEIDGEEYYLKASQESSNELGKKLLQSLATEEDTHRQKFQEIYDAIRSKKAWPVTGFQPDRGKRLSLMPYKQLLAWRVRPVISTRAREKMLRMALRETFIRH